jgi:hypothetical protein
MMDHSSAAMPSDEDLVKALAWHALIRTGGFDEVTGRRAQGAVPLIYVDKNPWGRSLDDQAVPRNAAEAAAFASVLAHLERGTIRLAYSSVSFGEGSPRDGSEGASRAAIRGVVGLAVAGLPVTSHAERADTTLVADFLYRSRRIRGYDAIHAAAALLEGVWYFVTGDDRLRRRLETLYQDWSIPATAESPVTMLAQIEGQGRSG